MFDHIIARTLRVPTPIGQSGNGSKAARQLDSALMQVGFKLSGELLQSLSELHPTVVTDLGHRVLSAVRKIVGDHVQHNTYFRDFPEGVPDTTEFWLSCIVDALTNPSSAATVSFQLETFGMVNLLDLPRYGRYQHTYSEMVAAHEQFIPGVKDRVTVLHLGGSLKDETVRLYTSLAGSTVPLSEDDRAILAELAELCLDDDQPEVIPVRENRALINSARLKVGKPLLLDTVTDVLRLCAALSGGDVGLVEKFRFTSFPRSQRRTILACLNSLVEADPRKLSDVRRHRELWKRLGERLHPHEHAKWQHALDVFAVARGDKRVRTLMGKVEVALANDDARGAIDLLSKGPGLLLRSLDRLLRTIQPSELPKLVEAVTAGLPKVSGRVILSLREHLQNRTSSDAARVFVNRSGKSWVTEDAREPLDREVVAMFAEILDTEILRRLPEIDHLVIDDAVRSLALPLSSKTAMDGFGIMPRGSVSPVDAEVLRFFIYWKEAERRTDFDLSAMLLDENFQMVGQLSWTQLEAVGGVHSGDITEAPDGASEFIDLDLDLVRAKYIVPQVLVYSGEGFDEVEESFFGFMSRTAAQKGLPFEAKTVRMKSDLRGSGRVALPLVFIRGDDGSWSVKWLHLHLKGRVRFNQVETTKLSTSLLARAIVEREYLRVGYLLDLLARKARKVSKAPLDEISEPVHYVGLEVPESLPEGSKTVVLGNLQDLTPA